MERIADRGAVPDRGAYGRRPDEGAVPRLRPAEAGDAGLLRDFFDELSFGARYFRFGHGDARLDDAAVASLCAPDPREGAAWVATCDAAVVACAGYCLEADGLGCEMAVVVADAWQGCGLGRRIVVALVQDARRRGLRRVSGRVLTTNRRMLDCVRGLGFDIEPWDGSSVVLRAVLRL